MTDNNETEIAELDAELNTDDTDEQEEMIQEVMEQANQFHMMMDEAKPWAREASSEIRIAAATTDDEEMAEKLEQVAEMVNSVAERVEQGDNNRARQPSGGR